MNYENYCNQKFRAKIHQHDPTKFPNIYFSKTKVQHNFCSFRFKLSIHEVFHQHLKSVLLLLQVNFVSGFRLELIYISFIESIRSNLTHLHGFQQFVLLPRAHVSFVPTK